MLKRYYQPVTTATAQTAYLQVIKKETAPGDQEQFPYRSTIALLVLRSQADMIYLIKLTASNQTMPLALA
jgi:hypothetical protein